MKSKALQRIEIFASALLLTLLLACKPATKPAADQSEAPPATANEAVAEPAAPVAPAAPAVSAAPSEAAKPAAPATGTVLYAALPNGSDMTMEGTSTIHDWSMKSLVVGGSIEADAGFPESALTDANAAKPQVKVFMPVRSFKSNSKKMDEVMQEHMKMAQFKNIEYKLTELKPKSPAGSTGPIQFEATGDLTVAGKTRAITMPVTVEKKDGKLKITGSTPLKMTDYDVTPPAPTILGMQPLKTGDDIKITFTWLLAPKSS